MAATAGKARAELPKDLPSLAGKICRKAAAKGKRPVKPSEPFEQTTNVENKESSDEEKKAPAPVVNKELVKCLSCKKDGNECMVNPSTVGKPSPACYECFAAKKKCPLYRKPGGESRKRKPATVPPGGARELAGKWFGCHLIPV